MTTHHSQVVEVDELRMTLSDRQVEIQRLVRERDSLKAELAEAQRQKDAQASVQALHCTAASHVPFVCAPSPPPPPNTHLWLYDCACACIPLTID